MHYLFIKLSALYYKTSRNNFDDISIENLIVFNQIFAMYIIKILIFAFTI